MSLDDLRSQLASMPSVDELVDYDLSCRNIVDDTPDRDTLRRLIDDADETVAFNALLAELSLLWRDRDFAQYRAQVESVRGRWRQDERTRGLFLGLEAQACSSSTNEHALRTGLGYARNSLEYLPSRPKLLNIFAMLVASLADQGKADDELLAEAEDFLHKALHLTPGRPKYKATLARIHLNQGRYDEAKEAIRQAIELEDSSKPHYALRVGDYQGVRMSISFGERSAQLQDEHKAVAETLATVRSEFDVLRTQVFGMLGLLAAVIAFIVTGVQVAREQTLSNASGLMIVIAASILTIFAGFRLLFLERSDDERGERRAYVVLFLGLVVIAGVWAASKWA